MKNTVSKYFTQRLKELQVDYVFAVPGEHSNHILKEFSEDKFINLLCTRNEFEASYAALGYAKNKQGQPGCFTLSSGQSSTKTVSAIASALNENLPVIFINCAPSSLDIFKGTQGSNIMTHNVQIPQNEREMFAKYSVHTERIVNAQLAPSQIDMAITACLTYSGPVYIEVLENVLHQETQEISGKITPKTLISQPKELEKAVTHIVNSLQEAKNPIVWLGSSVSRFNARKEFVQMIEKIGVNFFTSTASKSVVNEKHDHFIGVFTGKSSSKSVIESIKNSDIIYVFGETNTEIDILAQTVEDFQGRRIIYLRKDSVKENNKFQASPVYIKDVLNLLKDQKLKNFNQKNIYEPFIATFEQQDKITYDSTISQLVQSKLVNEKSSIIVDSTLALFPTSNIRVSENGFSSMVGGNICGQSLPFTVGAFAANKSKRPIVVIGDYSFQNVSQTLSTLSRMNCNAIIIIMNNQSMGIQQWISNPKVYQDPKEPIDSYHNVHQWDYVKFAETVESFGFKCETNQQLNEIFKKIESITEKMCVIDVKIPQKNIPQSCQWRVPQSRDFV